VVEADPEAGAVEVSAGFPVRLAVSEKAADGEGDIVIVDEFEPGGADDSRSASRTPMVEAGKCAR
jgi:hypothetical protein